MNACAACAGTRHRNVIGPSSLAASLCVLLTQLDPASSGGIKHNLSKTLLAVNIPMMGHHADLMFSNPADTPELTAARTFEMSKLRAWATRAHHGRQRMHRAGVARCVEPSASDRPGRLPAEQQTSSGPAHGSLIVVGGHAVAPAIYDKVAELAGGRDALIAYVPTNSGQSYKSALERAMALQQIKALSG